MKIVYVIATLDKAGTEVKCVGLAQELARRFGVENCFFYRIPGTRQFEDAVREASLSPPIEIGMSRLPAMWKMFSFCKKNEIDSLLIHFFGIDAALLGLAARAGGVAHVVSVAGSSVPSKDEERRTARVVCLSAWLATVSGTTLIATSNWILDSIRAVSGPRIRARVIHNGCDIEQISPRAAVSRSTRPDVEVFTVGMVARLDSSKDHETVIRAFASLAGARPDHALKLRLVGDGPLRGTLEALTESLGIEQNVEFLGARRDVPEILGQLDVSVLSTSRVEGFGLVLIEAMAAGVPVVASDVPACREVLRGGELGELFSYGDVQGLADILTRHHDAMLENAKRQAVPLDVVRRSYGLDRMVSQYARLLGVRE